MIDNLPNVLPCAKCRKHAREYIMAHPLKGQEPPRGRPGVRMPETLPSYVTWKPEELREWLWQFHNAVTQSIAAERGAPAPEEFPQDQLTLKYGPGTDAATGVGEDISALNKYLVVHAIRNRLNPSAFRLFRAQVDQLRAVYRF